MILSDVDIEARCMDGALVAPYVPENLQPASIDVALHDEWLLLDMHDQRYIDLRQPPSVTGAIHRDEFVLHPGQFVLACTREVVNVPDDLVSRIEGKSSIGRMGLAVHVTAGFIDPGFYGRITLEMVNLNTLPIVLVAGQLIAQLSFHLMSTPARKPYKGRYQGDMGVAGSR